jgi:hypothetical protein
MALLILNAGARRGWVVSTTPRPLYPRKDPVLIVQEAGRAPGPVWTCAKNLVQTGIRSPDRPARSQSLYRLRYTAHNVNPVLQEIRGKGVELIRIAGERVQLLPFVMRQRRR